MYTSCLLYTSFHSCFLHSCPWNLFYRHYRLIKSENQRQNRRMGISFGYGRYNPYRKYLWIELTSFQQCSMIQSETAERTLSIKLPEFRKQIETYSIEELRYLTAELYKAIPKKIKEEKDIDPLVLSVPEHFKEKDVYKRQGLCSKTPVAA